jgi:hypothetical protein
MSDGAKDNRPARAADQHSVDYFDTFIAVAPDSAAESATSPPTKPETPSIAARTHSLIAGNPYGLTSGDVIFTVWADRRDIPQKDRAAARTEFYSKGQPCLRSSDLGKRYGWGIHSDAEGRVALYPVDSPEYAAFASGVSPVDGSAVVVTRAMRSSRASQ